MPMCVSEGKAVRKIRTGNLILPETDVKGTFTLISLYLLLILLQIYHIISFRSIRSRSCRLNRLFGRFLFCFLRFFRRLRCRLMRRLCTRCLFLFLICRCFCFCRLGGFWLFGFGGLTLTACLVLGGRLFGIYLSGCFQLFACYFYSVGYVRSVISEFRLDRKSVV